MDSMASKEYQLVKHVMLESGQMVEWELSPVTNLQFPSVKPVIIFNMLMERGDSGSGLEETP